MASLLCTIFILALGHEMTSIKDVTEYAKHAGYTDGFPESPNRLNLAYLITFDNGEGQISWYTVISANYVTASEQEMCIRDSFPAMEW